MAINDVSLTSGMRSNLLSLQNTVELLNRTQNRLSTGKKVNSAIDNPVSFFASQALTNRASKIDGLKDAMGQAIQTITAADKGISAINSMIEQAKGIAQSAQSAAAGTTETESTTGAVAFSAGTVAIDVTDMKAFSYANVTLTLGSIAGDETVIVGATEFTFTDAGGAADFTNVSELADLITAALSNQGYVAVADGDELTISLTSGAFVSGDITGTGKANLAITENAEVAADTIQFGGSTYTVGEDFSDTAGLITLLEADNYNASAVGNVITVSITGTTVLTSEFTVSSNIDVAVDDAEVAATLFTVNGTVLTTGVDFQVGATDAETATNLAAAITAAGLGSVAVDGTTVTVTIASTELTNLQTQYNELRTQLTALAGDSGYKGKNLLNSDTLSVQFEGNTLAVAGFDASATGLGITAATWSTGGSITADLTLLDTALNTLSQESSKMSGNLSIITVRQEFSTNMINTLTEGSDKLTLADTNEEGANMLMLQTRQSLSTTALSLSAQAAQSVLRLFQ